MIKAVKLAVPNPQVPIKIIVENGENDFSKNDFQNKKATELKSYYWVENANIREEAIYFDESGYIGNAIVGIIEQNGFPVEKVDVHSNETNVNGQKYSLSLQMHWETNEIKKKGDSIEINDTGDIKLTPRTQTLAKSNASFSIHGINYSGGLFPEYSFNAKKTMLLWPFPMLIVLDLNGNNDLDLNSARNEIVLNELWNSFEQNLAFIICRKLSENLKEEYISRLYSLFRANSKNDNFLVGLEKAQELLKNQ